MPWQIHDLLIDLDRYSTHICIWLALMEDSWYAWSDVKVSKRNKVSMRRAGESGRAHVIVLRQTCKLQSACLRQTK